uniref:Uncharacterized protein n=1 Tax=Octactis speculum TaxID=3111310 RepID=A0A7S2AUJ5_9STRA|mmetsp:Transcript_15668/g.21067  ORF Transcript_15668/g.21067 Transcript_15668/m.21067 type:complete len:133 (+) Transcript_15668:73-471(+)
MHPTQRGEWLNTPTTHAIWCYFGNYSNVSHAFISFDALSRKFVPKLRANNRSGESADDIASELMAEGTPLHWAAMQGHSDVIRLLTAYPECDVGVPLRCRNPSQHSEHARVLPGDIARANEFKETVEALGLM